MTLCAADEYDADILPFLLKEFPYLNLSSETLYNMWRQGARQLQYLSGQSAAAKKGRKNKQRQAVNRRIVNCDALIAQSSTTHAFAAY